MAIVKRGYAPAQELPSDKKIKRLSPVVRVVIFPLVFNVLRADNQVHFEVVSLGWLSTCKGCHRVAFLSGGNLGISLRKYAAHRGVSLAAVQKAIQSGRIRREKNGSIDPVRADADWQNNTRASTSRLAIPSALNDVIGEAESTSDFQKARTMRLFYEMKLTQLELGVREGRLLDSRELDKVTFNRARRLRDRLLMIPRRIAAQIAAETDRNVIKNILQESFADALEDIADPDSALPITAEMKF